MISFPVARSLSTLLLIALLAASSVLHGQNQFTAVVADSASGKPVVGANAIVRGTVLGGVTDTLGRVTITGIPDGAHTIAVSCVGYRSRVLPYDFPLAPAAQPVTVLLGQEAIELGAVTVTTTRTSYHLYDVPVRIEVKGEEDIGETMIDHPSNISELFLESTGIQVLQTSPISNSVSIKLQGLDGSYTQILKDGFPLYGGLSAGLSVTQIPPLDLRRVEIVKGPSSSLYGAGAMAGIINLISKTPAENARLMLLLNGTSARGVDGGLFYSGRKNNVGYTVLMNGTANAAYDADRTGFSDIPRTELFTINPKVFYDLSDNTRIVFGLSTTSENTTSGDMTALSEGTSLSHPYIERTKSNRSYTQLDLATEGGSTSIDFKNSIGYFHLNRSLMSDRFDGTQWSTYSELSAQMVSGEHTLTGGVNLTTDRFLEDPADSVDRSYTQWTAGLFGQDDWKLAAPLTVETGLRIDWENRNGLHAVPRIAAIYHVTDKLGLRVGAGLGYKVPTIFSDQSDPSALYRLEPIHSDVRVESSVGGEFDVAYNTIALGAMTLALNQAFFSTRVDDPLVPVPENASAPANGRIALINAKGYLYTAGAETDIKLTYDELEAFVGYTYTHARGKSPERDGALVLTPTHNVVMDVLFDMEGAGEGGVELRYTSPQLLNDGTRTPGFWVLDCLFQTTFSHVTFFVAVENALDLKEANYTPVFSGTSANPRFNDVWAPLEGRIVNGGVKFQM